ncbi:M42 family metallopeptidase [Fimbriimonas ginsengisoli]|uniref:Peptidase M42 family protein n=1 Tax=Fimbriimonas ginsengisoli Gsoil 348 TaxID=661478 RepID=A0A068NP22_FIMGI|nr:M42 family metallopeptidase [Fimbriimonas ginsengisoli]AIE85186.1 peptidase M42 family protein [Fimbriimonas ginsengisoli Gsoil 348]
MALFEISTDYLKRTLVDLLNTPSPTGDTEYAISFVQGELESMGVPTERTTKGALLAHIEGLRSDQPRALTAHVDTLGAMVKEIKPNGRLRLTALNGLMWPTVESESLWIATRSGRQVRGSLVLENGAAHVNREAATSPRTEESLEVRLDERTSRAEETRMLGIEVGDFVYFDPRVEVSEAGFVRSRFLDDKACVAAALAAVKAIVDGGVTPAQQTTLLISNYEEVGHGGRDGLPDDIVELVVLDMACIGKGLQGDEFHCSLCVKDSSGPYSKNLSDKLRNLAERRGIDLKADVYPFYGSDGSFYWRSGGRAEVALIGPGVDTSHGYERTHSEALVDTARLIAEYLVEE